MSEIERDCDVAYAGSETPPRDALRPRDFVTIARRSIVSAARRS
ncbi:hypothetical protein [Rarobacter incanus]|nr:hypothetical protein [Rarobacter incanus]